jgi:spermidine/putrescine transport system permease protein
MTSVAVETRRSRPDALSRAWAFVRHHLLTAYSILFFAYLMLPIAVVAVFSFNHPKGRFNFTWERFTISNWTHWNAIPGIQSAVELSLEIALVASLLATALGTLMPLATPEIVLGASLLSLFLNRSVPLGFWTILIAHVMFCVSFAVVTVKARLVSFDRHLEEAAMDLGANEWTTFRKVTLPLIAPAILASLLLCFAISVDDFVVTYFVAGNHVTFPIFVWGAARVATPPQINVIGIAFFVIAVTAMLGNVALQSRRAKHA